MFHEQDRHLAISQARELILSLFKDGDAEGGAKRPAAERDCACIAVEPRPGNALARSIRNLGYSLSSLFLKTAGRLSKGIRLGWQLGFDAGRSLDYVYRNQPEGWSVLGRLMDKIYLNAPGWRGIRQRRVNLQQALDACIDELHDQQERVHIMDVAAGPGRLLIETAAARNDSTLSFTCRDFSEAEVEAARALATELGAAHVNCELANAFNPASFEDLAERPDVVIVSGLYELFSDNVLVTRSLKAINNCLNDDGYLIYTNQPHHPQLEQIAGTLINRDGDPWIMRPRSQTEMRELLADAGFEIGDMRLDENGIFVVGVARKANRSGK